MRREGSRNDRRRTTRFSPDSLGPTTRLEERLVPTATLPAGFTESIVATGLLTPTAMEIAPDGRIFVAEQTGNVRIVKDGNVLPDPFLHLDVYSVGERGLLGLTLDPNFASNHFVYLYYTTNAKPIHNRVVRVTADGDRAAPGSITTLIDLDAIDARRFFHHVGGAMHFGNDGKLYVTTGDLGSPQNSQSLKNLSGKVLRLNRDGSIPSDNPFARRLKGKNRAIWAYGLRNPFTFAVQPSTGKILLNDVGFATFEEINQGKAGANYGWPKSEGPRNVRRFARPIYFYRHGPGPLQGCAITGATFYEPRFQRFPGEYRGDFFFGDYCNGWIHALDPKTGKITSFASNLGAKPIDLDVTPSGDLLLLGRGDRAGQSDAIYKIEYAPNAPPAITLPPSDTTVTVGGVAEFSVSPSGSSPFSYQWQKNGQDLPGATDSTLKVGASLSDNGAKFRAIVSNAFGVATSDEATLHVTTSLPPIATILTPGEGESFQVGQVVTFSGSGSDPEDGDLPASAFTWQVDLDNHGAKHPIVLPTSGVKSGEFTLPSSADLAGSVVFRITLTVKDSAGLKTSTVRTILPKA